ncbi:bidirectional sugar transporter SWEET1 [Striga asiatica]|uniref:Bidirectional sugar transporter SWEET1 n=1 Tax=Striga asiatica TaxID=4170 RepID=A0A5A7QTT8_STRAF|nr:bidirectional sugar transporter SWEET1 [Striga asiatica]
MGNAFALFLYLSPVVTFKRILKKKSTEQFSGIPFVLTLLNCLIGSWYGLPFVSQNNFLIATVNITGAALQAIFLTIFLIYAPRREKNKVIGVLTLVLVFYAIYVFVSLFALHGNGRRLFCGTLTTICAIIMFAGPMVIIIPSACGSGFGTLQLILYAMYHKNKGQTKKSTADDQATDEKIDSVKIQKEKPSNGHQSQDEQV